MQATPGSPAGEPAPGNEDQYIWKNKKQNENYESHKIFIVIHLRHKYAIDRKWIMVH